MVEVVLTGGRWDGHVERVAAGDDGLPPARLPRFRETAVYTEDTGFLPMRIPERGYVRRSVDPADPAGLRWIYEPDPDDPLP